MIEAFAKSGISPEMRRKNINKSVAVGFLNAVLQMFQVAAIYFVVLALTDGEKKTKTAWIALVCELDCNIRRCGERKLFQNAADSRRILHGGGQHGFPSQTG